MSEPVVRILILGTGFWAATHATTFAAIPGCRVVAGVDANGERVKSFCDTHGIPRAFDNLDEAIGWGEFDAVSNVTPDAIHHATTMKLIAAGKHVLCEKPVGVTIEEAETLREAVARSGKVFQVGHMKRFDAGLQSARAFIDNEMGELVAIKAWYCDSTHRYPMTDAAQPRPAPIAVARMTCRQASLGEGRGHR